MQKLFEDWCLQLLESYLGDIIEYYADNYRRALPDDFAELLTREGFVCWQNNDGCVLYETGWYPGQNDNPEDVYKAIKEDDKRWQVVFVITAVGQFDINWTAFIRLGS